jgi:exonuclease SbcC
MKIAHIADVHIRVASRHSEYVEVFEKLYKSLKKEQPDLIYIAGDIFHSKLNLSPEAIVYATEFLDNLTDIAETLLILGNHDASLNSKRHRMDALEPLRRLTKGSKNPLHIWQDSGMKEIGDVKFFHYSCLDEVQPDLDEKSDTLKNICLHHGMVQGAKTDKGYVSDKSDRNIPFEEFDATLLGDVHKVQSFAYNVFYAGSLICQNFGEDPFKHGYMIHDTDDLSSPRYIEISNDYTYITLTTEGGKLPDVKVKPTYRVRVNYSHKDSLDELKSEYYDKYGDFSGVKFNEYDGVEKRIKNIEVDGGQKIDLTDPKQQEKFIKMYFEDDEDVDRVIELNEEMFKNLDIDNDGLHFDWKLKKMTFDHAFSYGAGNRVDFTKHNGVIGVFGKNATGKSSLLDTMSYLGFGNFPKMDKNGDFVNNKQNEASGELTFGVGEQTGFIKRKTKVNAKGNSTNELEFVLGDKNLTENITNTKNNIEKYIGSYDDYLRTAYISQQSPDLFLNMKNSERKEWLASNLNIDFMQKLHELAKKESKDLKSTVDYLSKTDWQHELGLKYKERNTYQDRIAELTNQLNPIKENEDDQENEIDTLKGKKKNVPDFDEDINELKRKVSKQSDNINELNNIKNEIETYSSTPNPISKGYDNDIELLLKEKEDVKNNFKFEELIQAKLKYKKIVSDGKKLKSEIDSVKDELNDLDVVEDLDEKIKDLESEIKLYHNDVREYKSLKREIESLQKKSKILDSDDRFKNEELCQSCPLLTDVFDSKKEEEKLQKEMDEFKYLDNVSLDELNSKLEKYKNERIRVKELREELDRYQFKIDQLRDSRDELKKSIINLKSKREEYLNHELSKIDSKIEKLKDKIEYEVKSKLLDLEKNKSTIENNLEKIEIYKGKIKEYEKYEEIKEQNKIIDRKIDNLLTSLEDLRHDLNEISELLRENKTSVQIIENEIKNIEEKDQELEEAKNEYIVYEKYIEATHKNNLPTLIIENVLDIIKTEVNNVLSNMSDYRIDFGLDGDKLVVHVSHPNKGILNSSRLSGMESFLINLAIRIGLKKLSNTPTANFLVVDEGFSSLDKDMVQDLPYLFDYLKNEFDFIIIVSHNEYMVDFVDHNFEIHNQEGLSYINE